MGYFTRLGAAVLGRALQVKASAVGPLIARVMVGQAVWPNRDYAKFGREGYQQNPIVARSVQLVADGVASIVLEVHKGRGRKTTTIDDHPLLARLAQPNPEQDGQAFIVSLVPHLMISGNAYLERTDEENLDRMELYALRPDRMRVVPGPDQFAQGYEYWAGGDKRRFDIDVDRGLRPILHLKKFHPVDDFYGMSPLDPAGWSIDTHNAAAAFNKALLDNSATPSGAYVYKAPENGSDTLSDEQYDRLRSQLEKQVQGARNAGKPLLLEGGLDWKQLGLNLENLQFVDAKNLAAREIAFTLGVPPMLLGIPGDNTYSNYAEANRAFYRQTVIPMANWICRSLTHWFQDTLDTGERLVVDLDSITALDVERQALWDKLDRTKILTINEKREALGYQPVGGGDDVYVGAGDLPISGDATVQGGPEPDVNELEDDTSPTPGGKRPPHGSDKRRLS